MSSNRTIGQIGEDLAERFLSKSGYRILNRNYRTRYGEIDITVQDRKGTLVFVEVKTLVGKLGEGGNEKLTPEDNLTRSKLDKLKRICAGFANDHRELIRHDRGWQIDLVAITLDQSCLESLSQKNLTKDSNCFKVSHYENIAAR